MSLKEAIEILKRRREHLSKRIEKSPTINLDYDKAEASALKKAIEIMQAVKESNNEALIAMSNHNFGLK